MNEIKPKEIDVREENKIGLHAIKRSIPESIMESLPEAQNQAQQIVCRRGAEFSKVVNSIIVLRSKTYDVAVTVTEKTCHARL